MDRSLSHINPLLVVGVLAFGGVHLLLAAVPAQAEVVGGRPGPGTVTAALMVGTVVGQLASPWMRRRTSSRTQLVVAGFLLGGPAPLYGASGGLVGVTAVTLVRGLGFGILTVTVTAFLVANVAPARRGAAIGRLGLVTGIAGMIATPAGVALWQADPNLTWWAGAASALAGIALSLSPSFTGDRTVGEDGRWVRPERMGNLTVSLAGFACATIGFAAVLSLVPVRIPAVASIVLLITTTAMTIGRWAVGWIIDRWGAWRFLPIGLASTTVGLWWLGVANGGAWPHLGGAAFGLGFGMMTTASLVAVVAEYGERRLSTASAVWNVVFDSGTGVGGVLVAVLAAGLGYGPVFGVFAILNLAGMVTVLGFLATRARTP